MACRDRVQSRVAAIGRECAAMHACKQGEEDSVQRTWNEVDQYLTDLLVPPEPALDAALAAIAAANLPAQSVSPLQGKLLHLLARISQARQILEIGTLGGYSAIWLARALQSGGRLITLERKPRHAAIARENIARAGLADVVDVRLGRALDSLALLQMQGLAPFDLIFIDADKVNNPAYLAWALKLSRPGSVIVIDNVVRGGAITDAADAFAGIQGTRRMFELIANTPGLSATALQTVGRKGYDGFAIAVVGADER